MHGPGGLLFCALSGGKRMSGDLLWRHTWLLVEAPLKGEMEKLSTLA